MKKFVSWMLSLIMIISIIPVTPASAADAVASGSCGTAVTWTLYDTDDDGTGDKLVISGSGEMADYEYVGGEQLTTSPWVEYREEITSVVIDEGVTHIGDEAFAFFYNLALIDIPLSVETIGRYSFCRCLQIQNVELPAGITSIGEGAFVSCRTLTNMVFPQGLTTIGDCSFSGCNLLETVYIPNTLESIGEAAFEATVLTDVYYDGTVAEWNNVVINSNNNELFSATIHCTDADYETIKSSGICGDDLTWTRYYNGKIVISGTGPMYDYEWDTSPFKSIGGNSIILEDGVTSIGNYALGYLNCTEVSIPNTVTSIGNEAFLYCTALKSITIPNSVTTIGDYAFSNTAIESITVPGSVTTIGLDIFHPCESLKNVVLSEGITYIAGAMFANCTALETVVIPSSVTTIDYLAFYNTSLSSITIPEGVKSIGAYAFNSCTELSNVNYTGSKSQWTEITIESNNEALTNATIVYGKYDIVTADPENGTVSVDKATVARGETVTVTVTPAENYELEKILVNDVEITGNTFTPVEDSTVTAVFKYVGGVKIGDTYYETLADAVAAAQSGETIKLLKDTATSGVLALTDSLTLDLNGYTLTSEYIVAFNGNNIIDSSESNSGLLVVAEDKFAIAKNNSQLPVKTESGYKFYEMVKINERLLSKEKYVFQPIIEPAVHQEVLKGMEATDVQIIVEVTYKSGDDKTGKREFVYSDSFVETFVNSYNAETGKYSKMFSLTISDADKFESLTFTTRVVFADKVEFASPLA